MKKKKRLGEAFYFVDIWYTNKPTEKLADRALSPTYMCISAISQKLACQVFACVMAVPESRLSLRLLK